MIFRKLIRVNRSNAIFLHDFRKTLCENNRRIEVEEGHTIAKWTKTLWTWTTFPSAKIMTSVAAGAGRLQACNTHEMDDKKNRQRKYSIHNNEYKYTHVDSPCRVERVSKGVKELMKWRWLEIGFCSSRKDGTRSIVFQN